MKAFIIVTDNQIPAVTYMKIVRLFAIAKGLPFLTWNQQKIAIEKYEKVAKHSN